MLIFFYFMQYKCHTCIIWFCIYFIQYKCHTCIFWFCIQWLAFYLQASVLSALCNLVVRCTNFKVRANATTAIRYVSKREYFGSQFITAWTSLSDGLDNAANMTDFKEFKHQDNLMEQVSFHTFFSYWNYVSFINICYKNKTYTLLWYS